MIYTRLIGAEQIEGVALAIDAIERGTGGFVIGHQTGVGKGRMLAAIMRYAKKQGSGPHLSDGRMMTFSLPCTGICRTLRPT